MPGQTVVFEVAAQHQKAVAAFLEVAQAADQTGRAGGKAGDEMKRTGDQAGDAWNKGLGVLKSYPAALLQMVSGVGAVLTAVQLVREELERVNVLRGKAMEGLDTAMPAYKLATLQVSEGYRANPMFDRLVSEGIRARGDATSYFEGLAEAMSAAGGAGGGIGEEEAHRATNLVAALAGKMGMPNEDFKAIVAGLIDSMQVDSRMGKPLNAKELLGKIMSGWPASRPSTMGEWATNELQLQNLLIQNSGFTREESIGFASVLGSMMIDPHGRRTRTTGLTMQRGLAEAYAQAEFYGAPATDERGEPISVADFRKLGLRQLEIARSDTKTGEIMRAWLAPRTDEERRLGSMLTNNPAHIGKLEGEAGGKEVGELLLDPSNNLLDAIKEVIKTLKHGAAAEALVDKQLTAPPSTVHEEYYADRHRQRGAVAAMQWDNIQQARRGSFQQFVKDMGDFEGTGAIQQKLRDLRAAWKAGGKSQEEIRAMEVQAAAELLDYFMREARIDPAQMDAELEKFAPGQRRNLLQQGGAMFNDIFGFDREGFGARSSFPGSVQRRWIRERATPPQEYRGQVEALREFINSTSAGASGARAPALAPAATDGAAIQQSIQELGSAIAALQSTISSGMFINVTVEDGLGQQLGHTTSRPRLLEQLNEAGIG